jgi:hypothetical protein
MPNPQKWQCHSSQITARGIIRLLSGGGSHKIVLVGTKQGKIAMEKVSRKGAHLSKERRQEERSDGLGVSCPYEILGCECLRDVD